MVAGRIVAGRPIRLACERHLRDLEDGPKRGLRWDRDAAERAIGYFPDVLRLAEGEHAGKPFVLQPWQQFKVGSLFGWKGDDGFRRFRTAYMEEGKGNGKSPLAAGVGLYGLTADGEAAAQIYSAATAREQARIVWGDADRMVQASPALRSRIERTVSNLAVLSTSSFFRAVSADASRLDGFRPHMVIADEVHEHHSPEVIDKMRAGFKGRRQPLLIEITNSGFDRHSICWQHHEFSLKVLEGTLENDSWFAYIAALDEGDDPFADEACWIKANPNLDVSVTRKYLREQVEEARDMPAKRSIVLRLNFCVWTEGSGKAIDMDAWTAGGPAIGTSAKAIGDSIDEMARELEGRDCFGGIDLGRVNDLSAYVKLFPPADDDPMWRAIARFYCPEDDILVRSKRDRVPYALWRDQGFLTATPGNATDYEWIRADILEDAGRFQFAQIGFDRTFAGELVNGLMDEGLTMVGVGQGFLSMAAPTAELMRLLRGRLLWHGGHPILRWCASNLVTVQDPAGNLKPDKSRSSEKIDGIAALLNALHRAMTANGSGSDSQSIYEERGLMVFG